MAPERSFNRGVPAVRARWGGAAAFEAAIRWFESIRPSNFSAAQTSAATYRKRRNGGFAGQSDSMRFGIRLSRVAGVVALSAVLAWGIAPGGAAAAGAPAVVAATSDEASALFTKAQGLFHDRKFREAIALLDPYLAANPRDARALVLRGDCKADLEDNQGALRDYNAAIGISPEYQYAYVTRCETRRTLDDIKGALADCDTAIRLDATDALAYEDRGDVYFDRESWSLALADYDKAVELGRSNAYLFAARCDANRLTGNRAKAAADCEKAFALDPKSRRALWSNGRLALTGERYTDAVAHLNSYIAQDSKGSNTAYYFRGYAYNRLGSYKLALEDLQTYVQRAPKDADGYRERGIARNGLGDKEGALADLDVAQRDYRKDGNTPEADRVAAMVKAVRAGQPITP